ncbi:TPA: tape measure protein [Klebsiella oxytoca]|uniref:tape measure protein n=1 Tax=Klebsiella oxytoca TaxID=571 RepID=UPI0021E5E89F|nr:tape measure protein [Klebsiella oxytoca]UYH03474.1 tape measure protein [Klebsiella oxytoca]HDW1387299.1 tape measure protein [Klebsiella oxytoca]HDW1411528.1 tape measure protein [Klebsiella oxytoca]
MAENAGGIYYELDIEYQKLLVGQQKINQRLDQLETGFDNTTKAVTNTDRSMSKLSRVAVSLAAALSVEQVAQYADAWATVSNKLANSVRPGEQLAEITERVFNITQQTRSSLDATASLYARLERATRQYGTSANDLARLTTIINKGFVVSGATAQEAENAIIQLSQGLASGALRGEEFNSVNEQGNRLIVALADSLGVSAGKMRELAAQGKLTTDVVVNGLLSQGAQIGDEFAKTTTTISQALQVAGNNITKFFGENASVKAGVSIFNDAVIGLSENIDILGIALTAVSAVMGGRYVGALTLATQAKLSGASAAIKQQVAEYNAAKATIASAEAEIKNAQAIIASEQVKARQLATQAAINKQYGLAVSYQAEYAAIQRNITAADNAATAAKERLAAATQQASVANRTYAASATLAKNALSLIGGPAGAAMLAAAAVYYFYQKAQQAKQESIDFADSLDGLTAKMKEISSAQISAAIAKTEQSIIDQRDALADLRTEYEQLEQKKTFIEQAAQIRGATAVAGDLSEVNRDLAIQAGKVDEAETKLSRTTSSLGLLRAQANGQFREGIDLLRRDGQEAGVVAGLMNNLGDAINFASRAKEKFNSSSLKVERPKNVQDYLDKLQEQVTLQSELNDRKRAQLKAEQDIRNLGGSEADVNLARDRAAAEYDAQQAQQNNKKATKESTSEAKKLATQQESVNQKLENLRQQSELAASSTQELSRDSAILRAQQSLGSAATQAQIQEAGQYAANAWDAAAAARGVTEALKAIPEQAENKSYAESMQNLKAALNAGEIDLQEYNTATEKMALDHQNNLAKINAQKTLNPLATARAEVDPVQQLVNENNQKLALMQQYQQQEQAILQQSYQQGKISYDQFIAAKSATDAQYLALRTAQENQYNQQMTEAQWQLLSQQSLGYNMLTSAVDAFSGNASNAITGLLTGTMSAQEAMRSLGNTILNSVINSIVQVGVEALKNYILGQTLGAASVASSVGMAATTASAWAPAAALASLATLGTNAAPASAGITSTVGLASGLALAGGRKNGGPVSPGNIYPVGEDNLPEFVQTSKGLFMIPGDDGRVFSNKDVTGGSPSIKKASTGSEYVSNSKGSASQSDSGGGKQIQVNVQFYDQTSGGQHSFEAQTMQEGNVVTVDAFLNDLDRGGPMTSGIKDRFGLSVKANGAY